MCRPWHTLRRICIHTRLYNVDTEEYFQWSKKFKSIQHLIIVSNTSWIQNYTKPDFSYVDLVHHAPWLNIESTKKKVKKRRAKNRNIKTHTTKKKNPPVQTLSELFDDFFLCQRYPKQHPFFCLYILLLYLCSVFRLSCKKTGLVLFLYKHTRHESKYTLKGWCRDKTFLNFKSVSTNSFDFCTLTMFTTYERMLNNREQTP